MSIPDIKCIDHRVKIWLLVVSLLTIAVLVSAAWREEFGSEWRYHQREYESILAARATDQRGRDLRDRFERNVRQTVVPELGLTDRCISCHNGIDDPRMTDVPNPYRVHPGDILRDHPPAQFGCTICHRGQGHAVVFAEAKADGYFWDYPMLPREFTQSSCGLCHTPAEVASQGGQVLKAGETLFHAKGCAGCHQLSGRGGNLGPALDNEGLKVAHQLPMAHVEGSHTLPQWLVEHFGDPQDIVAGSQMRNPGLSHDEITALTVYMLSLQQRDLPRSYLSPAFHASLAEQARPTTLTGEELYQRFCGTCHGDGRFGRYDKFYQMFFPAVRNAAFLAVADSEFVATTIRKGRPGTLMPAWGPGSGGLTADEIGRITGYLFDSYASAELESPSVPETVDLNSGDWERGAGHFRRLCIGCHGAAGSGGVAPALANAEFQALADAPFLFRTISYGRRNTAMPAFRATHAGGLPDAEILDLVAYVRSLGGIAGKPVAGNDTSALEEQMP